MKVIIQSATSPLMIVTVGYLAEFHAIINAVGLCENFQEVREAFTDREFKHFQVIVEPDYIAVFRKTANIPDPEQCMKIIYN